MHHKSLSFPEGKSLSPGLKQPAPCASLFSPHPFRLGLRPNPLISPDNRLTMENLIEII